MSYIAPLEVPKNYAFWGAVAGIGATLKRRVHFNRVLYKVFPNQYIILVGPPGSGKGTVLNALKTILSQANNVALIEGRITPQKFIDKISKGFASLPMNSNGNIQPTIEYSSLLFSTELPVLLENNEWLLPFLCDVWDTGSFSYETKSGGEVAISKIGQSLLGACTPSFLSKLSKDKGTAAIAGGFVSRCLFISSNTPPHFTDFWGERTAPVDTLLEPLVEDIQLISQMNGEFTFSSVARKIYADYIERIETDDFDSELIASIKARLWSHIGKTAIIISASESDSGIVEKEHMLLAIEQVSLVADQIESTFSAVGTSDLVEQTNKVMSFIEKTGVTTRSQILRSLWRHVTNDSLDKILLTLETMKFCSFNHRGGSQQIVMNPTFYKKKSSS